MTRQEEHNLQINNLRMWEQEIRQEASANLNEANQRLTHAAEISLRRHHEEIARISRFSIISKVRSSDISSFRSNSPQYRCSRFLCFKRIEHDGSLGSRLDFPGEELLRETYSNAF